MKLNNTALTVLWCFMWMGILFVIGVLLAFQTNAFIGSLIWIVGSVVLAFLGKIYVPALRAPEETKETWICTVKSIVATIIAMLIIGIPAFWIHKSIYALTRILFTPGGVGLTMTVGLVVIEWTLVALLFFPTCNKIEKLLGVTGT